MSLTAILANPDHPLTQFIDTRFPNIQRFLSGGRRRLWQADMIYPDKVPRSALRHIGRAFDYRLRYYFGVTPYHELVAYEGACHLAATLDYIETPDSKLLYRKVDGLIVWYDRDTGRRLFTYNPTTESAFGVRGDIFTKLEHLSIELALGKQLPEGVGEWGDEEIIPTPPGVLGDFFGGLHSLLSDCDPVGRRLSKVEEDKLNRYCVGLSQLEANFRGGDSGVFREGIESVESLDSVLDYAEPAWIDDLRALSWRFYDRYHHLLSLPTVLNPVFEGAPDVGGADGDLIIGQTLLEIKTVKYWKIESQSALRQLLGYVLLDYSDQYNIKRIGMYMARQGVTLRWDLETAIRSMSSGKSYNLNELRQQFREIAQDGRGPIPVVDAGIWGIY